MLRLSNIDETGRRWRCLPSDHSQTSSPTSSCELSALLLAILDLARASSVLSAKFGPDTVTQERIGKPKEVCQAEL